ncbi:hypothetical protein VC83_07400 [Pseudogymnoascus destructans]|uniref:Cytochrome b561 domain-containing protein n=2 Tax=Pseudogymnoascus destructans TaxID=655981 RepID=L8G7V3_PSED2|nr:uncharacterized protein VC83_07400 [Pseudogymnoascus destructans]ELR08723.1 hypothetical protein GMDG_03405 [Pseudogymnoascus destructans 20631-21]OAF56144.1 hypothetical protein VC83_07400 [Pseudogymnoascus destructans]
MAGATIFAVYTDGKGNVTVSPRDGTGHFEPLHSSSKTVTLLAGSKADATSVVANFKYRADEPLLQVQSHSSPFIGSWKEGPAFNTTDLAQTLDHHDDHSIYTLDLVSANVGVSQNPFLGASAAQLVGQPQGGAELDIALGKRLLKAHGTLMGVAWLIVYPAGAILMRLRWGGVWAHVFIQLVGTSMVIAAFAIGYTFSGMYGIRFNNTHTLFGASIFGLILVQPFLGIAHHLLYRREGKGTLFGLLHCWYGRAIIILAAVNGGLGLQMARNSRGGEIAWGVVAGVALLAYLGASVYSVKGNKMQKKVKDKDDEVRGGEGN